MGEFVVVRQNRDFEVKILALVERHHGEGHEQHLVPVEDVSELNPYGMLLAGLGTCTGVVLHTYAHYRDIGLDEVEFRLTYDRVFADDCKECEKIDEYREEIDEEVAMVGDLTPQERKKLFAISHQCPIYKMLKTGITVRTTLAEETAAGS
jgi:putative redox protein